MEIQDRDAIRLSEVVSIAMAGAMIVYMAEVATAAGEEIGGLITASAPYRHSQDLAVAFTKTRPGVSRAIGALVAEIVEMTYEQRRALEEEIVKVDLSQVIDTISDSMAVVSLGDQAKAEQVPFPGRGSEEVN